MGRFLPDTRLLRMRLKLCRKDFFKDLTRDRGPSIASESLGATAVTEAGGMHCTSTSGWKPGGKEAALRRGSSRSWPFQVKPSRSCSRSTTDTSTEWSERSSLRPRTITWGTKGTPRVFRQQHEPN
ncbi:hypothetical protein EYF80_048458 [Liparis tanakae]|uniref:Uncharacterized protein n=1 Tax=Liparis tanakae TaxID=230148 RepID=A0A4Z2FJP0_9TELE|nr:hypothetical protein EYF80_048458 [Liparis tanakae]